MGKGKRKWHGVQADAIKRACNVCWADAGAGRGRKEGKRQGPRVSCFSSFSVSSLEEQQQVTAAAMIFCGR